MNRRLLALTVVALALLSATGCKRLEARFTPPPTIVTQEATRAAAGAAVDGKLDKSTPEGLPLWPGATVLESDQTEDAYSLSLQTTDTYTDVLNGIVVGFEDAGWSVAREESGTEGARTAVLSIARDSEEGIITLTEAEGGLTQIDYVIAASGK
ncbi:MAG: hypothetical protein CVT67_11380 [Actinobacteria bacterium HGW-Actinobacteria-7]|jgi:hypothetical protein|nr:MAG: hypothetical protein CVT67_11380 [Actinobacteria bacterium HGW-Actinobacteria-7]